MASAWARSLVVATVVLVGATACSDGGENDDADPAAATELGELGPYERDACLYVPAVAERSIPLASQLDLRPQVVDPQGVVNLLGTNGSFVLDKRDSAGELQSTLDELPTGPIRDALQAVIDTLRASAEMVVMRPGQEPDLRRSVAPRAG